MARDWAKYYAEHADEIKAKRRAYYAANRERELAKAAVRRQSPEVQLAQRLYHENWRAAHAEELREAKAKWYAINREGILAQARGVPIPEFWPYGATGWPFDEVNAVVPTGLPPEVRADVCQELCLAVIAGEATTNDLTALVPGAKRRAYGEWALSMDWERADGWKLADTFAVEELYI